MCACRATRSRSGRGRRLRNRATVELRPSAPTTTRAANVSRTMSIFQFLAAVRLSAISVASSRTSAPSVRARLRRRWSNRLRLIAISLRAPPGRSTHNFWPPMAINSTALRTPCGQFRICSASSSFSRTGQHAGLMQSPQTFSRGNFSRSRTSVRNPAAAQNAAQLEPAGPPPTIATSTTSISLQCQLSRARHQHFWRAR